MAEVAQAFDNALMKYGAVRVPTPNVDRLLGIAAGGEALRIDVVAAA